MMTIFQLVFLVAVGLSAVAFGLSKIEFHKRKYDSPISKQHRKFFSL